MAGWRLYFKGALSVAEDFLEIDLGKVFDLPGCETDLLDRRPDAFADDAAWRAPALRLFVLLFGRSAFLPVHRGETFHRLALREGKQWEARDANRAAAAIRTTTTAIHDWLLHEFGVDKPGRTLAEPHQLDADGFVTAVRAALPKSRKWSAAEITRLKQEYAATLTPARDAAADILALERKLSDLVNAAYSLTPDDVALMWRTASPRMPLDQSQSCAASAPSRLPRERLALLRPARLSHRRALAIPALRLCRSADKAEMHCRAFPVAD